MIYCEDTKQVLSWHISKKCLFKHAKKLFEKAIEVAQIRPKKIITDGLYQYAAAIKKTIGWNWKVHLKQRFFISSGSLKNTWMKNSWTLCSTRMK
ncbi:DDE-type integrase/transposase/recombinase [Candidatus Woesearchaeota archaeon]|nr:MAG: hypothetical protein QS99_C0016G0074 [archaeon GW2011_AR4]MBS3130290.1 DDE-type integrase/transposase/recombinase [Candidatus Woesearchaeota archaeon]HIH37337.1 DDE-type integrase/transposase/recombinase [Candidatus Woesearchaeota archaeon]HIH48755.1 DDE-type integrase/transposase/recombinase [Candidatus Woesearchaeota archaeon]HIJ04148.1 DDE-type integrase/transposase/recombinase [Candidatus Woesearchaeota archaeon]